MVFPTERIIRIPDRGQVCDHAQVVDVPMRPRRMLTVVRHAGPHPAWTAVCVEAILVDGALTEADFVAYAPQRKSR